MVVRVLSFGTPFNRALTGGPEQFWLDVLCVQARTTRTNHFRDVNLESFGRGQRRLNAHPAPLTEQDQWYQWRKRNTQAFLIIRDACVGQQATWDACGELLGCKK